jgi:hypothetical protein
MTVFISDGLHQWNHTTCCHRFRTDSHRTKEVQGHNTQAVEQFNSEIKKFTAHSVRYMTLRHAVTFLIVYAVLYNTAAIIKTK